MSKRVTSCLDELEGSLGDFGGGAGKRKLELLRILDAGCLARSGDVIRLHEVLCFMRAYPDDAATLRKVERMLRDFSARADLRRFHRALSDTGIAGTAIQFSFFPGTAFRLARKWGRHLTIDWSSFEKHAKLEELLSQLALYGEGGAIDGYDLGARGWIEQLKGPEETDAEFLLRRLEQLQVSPFATEAHLEDLDITLKLSPGPTTPSRTREKYSSVSIVYPSSPPDRSRPMVTEELARPPGSARMLPSREGRKLIDLAHGAMVTRERELLAFTYGEPNDVRMVDCGQGLQIAYVGVIPERRWLIETLYGFLVLKNGVPVGYGSYLALFGSAEVAYTIFDTFRSAEAARIYGRVLTNVHHLFGSDVFVIDAYQIGLDNDDAIKSGAWWFYQKMGFRPRQAPLSRLMRSEEHRMKKNPRHRSSASTLKKLSSENLYYYCDRRRDDVIGILSTENVGLRVSEYLAARFGYDRRRAERSCAREAAELLGLPSFRGFSKGERLTWERWGPLLLILPGIESWPQEDRRELIEVVKAKGGRHELEYLHRFDRHHRLRRAIVALAQD